MWCSAACRIWTLRHPGLARGRVCARCGKGFEARVDAVYCSRFCCDVSRGVVHFRPEGAVIDCAVCGFRKAVQKANAKVCHLPECRRAWQHARTSGWRKANPERYQELQRRRDQARRARRRGLTSVVEHLTAREIFERDAWRCALCSGSVSKALRFPDPLSASIDHIVPLSLGGEHSAANVQLAHLGCNMRKGVAAANEQLRLVG